MAYDDQKVNIKFVSTSLYSFGNQTKNFKLLTKMMLSDVAMLSYLDNDRNSKDNPNENFASRSRARPLKI